MKRKKTKSRWAWSLGLLCLLFLPQWAGAQAFLIPKDTSLPPLALKHHRVSVDLQDRAAKTSVEMVFVNHTNRLLEATFLFPLPKGATVSGFVLYINGKPTKGDVLVREKAASIYQSIVRTMKDPGLIEYMGNNLFKARVFPIPRNGEQKLKISFTQVVPYRGGLHRFVYPMKTSKNTLRTLNDFTMSVNLKSKIPLKNVYSPTHKVSIARRGDKRAIIGFEKNQAVLNRDFVLYYSVSPKDVGINLMTYRTDDDNGYFLLMATPKTSYASKELPSKNVTFVIDTSGSMSGQKMKWARHALQSCLKKLNPKDYFNVIRFSTDVEGLFSGVKPANDANVSKAADFVKKLEAAGGTAIDEALATALKQKPQGDGVSLVMFITDGHPTIGETAPKSILKNAGKTNKYKTRVFTFGIGENINTKLLDAMAQQAKGTGDYVKPNREIAQRIEWFYDKVRYPVLSDIQMNVGKGVRLVDVYPKRLPDLYRGGQILVMGRYKGKGHVAISLEGKVSGQTKKFVYEAEFKPKSEENEFITRLWANRKVAYLLENIRLHGENPELKGEVIRLAKKFAIVTPYTSYLVVEDKDRWRLNGGQPPRPVGSGRPPMLIPRRSRRDRPMMQDGLRGTGGGTRFGAMKPGTSKRRRSAPAPVAPTRAEAVPKSAPVMRERRQAFKAGWKKDSGKNSIRASRMLRKMKEEKTLSSDAGKRARFVQGRVFHWRGGAWVDRKYKTSMKTLSIKYMSKAYFALLSKRPDLRRFLSLGRKVTVVIGKNKAIVVGGSESANVMKQLPSFLKR